MAGLILCMVVHHLFLETRGVYLNRDMLIHNTCVDKWRSMRALLSDRAGYPFNQANIYYTVQLCFISTFLP